MNSIDAKRVTKHFEIGEVKLKSAVVWAISVGGDFKRGETLLLLKLGDHESFGVSQYADILNKHKFHSSGNDLFCESSSFEKLQR